MEHIVPLLRIKHMLLLIVYYRYGIPRILTLAITARSGMATLNQFTIPGYTKCLSGHNHSVVQYPVAYP